MSEEPNSFTGEFDRAVAYANRGVELAQEIGSGLSANPLPRSRRIGGP